MEGKIHLLGSDRDFVQIPPLKISKIFGRRESVRNPTDINQQGGL
eukprot:UN24885